MVERSIFLTDGVILAISPVLTSPISALSSHFWAALRPLLGHPVSVNSCPSLRRKPDSCLGYGLVAPHEAATDHRQRAGELMAAPRAADPLSTVDQAAARELTPKKFEIHHTDEIVRAVRCNCNADLVGITTINCSPPHADELADKFRGRSEGSCWASGISRCCRLDCDRFRQRASINPTLRSAGFRRKLFAQRQRRLRDIEIVQPLRTLRLPSPDRVCIFRPRCCRPRFFPALNVRRVSCRSVSAKVSQRAFRWWRMSKSSINTMVWRDGRVAEGAGLLNRYRFKRSIGGSNPPLSATFIFVTESDNG